MLCFQAVGEKFRKFRLEVSGDLLPTVSALGSFEVVLEDVKMVSLNEQLGTSRTIGVFRFMAGDVSKVDKRQTFIHANLSGPFQFGNRCGMQVGELQVRGTDCD